MDHNAKPHSGGRVDQVLAAEQVAAVESLMDGIENLYGAVDHLALAFVRGFAHCEKVESADGAIVELRPVDQWHVVRDGIYRGWRYNPEARQCGYDALTPEHEMLSERFVTHEVERPLARIAIMKYVRSSLSEKDWGAFVEIYGKRTGIAILPPDVPPEQVADYLAMAQALAEGAPGAMPHGSDFKPNSGDKGSGATPFAEHCKYWTEKLVLAGTNGKLTMLAEAGSGTLGGNAHADTFESLSRADARRVSTTINDQLVTPYLRGAFPGRPVSAYWELAFREEVDAAAVVEDAGKLRAAGYRLDREELQEKTGYKVSDATSQAGDAAEITNAALQRAANSSGDVSGVTTAKKAETLLNRVSEAPEKGVEKALAAILGEVINGDGVSPWVDVLAEAVAEGLAEGLAEAEDGAYVEEFHSP